MMVIAIIISATLSAQEFMGIPISGKRSEAILKFQAKGFKLKKESGNVVIMQGRLQSQPVDLYITCTPTSKIVWKYTVYYPEESSWYNIKGEYKKLKQTITDKYGDPESYEFFSRPYYEGDGYETSAVKLEKCTYSSFWKSENLMIAVEITKFMQLMISYENQEGGTLKEQEQAKIDKNTF